MKPEEDEEIDIPITQEMPEEEAFKSNDELEQGEYYLNNKRLPRTDVEFEWTPEMLSEIAKCKKSVRYFAEKYFFITTLDEGKKKIALYIYQKRVLKALEKYRYNIVCSSRQAGKALDLQTPILTPTGWTIIGNIKSGDQVYDEIGNICNVVKAHDTLLNRNCYKIVFDNKEEIIADEEHLWFTQTRDDRRKCIEGQVRTTKEILNTLYAYKSLEPNHRIKKTKGIIGTKQDLLINPYILGVWLGDGSSNASVISIGKEEIIEMTSLINQPYTSCRADKAGNYFLTIKGKDIKRTTDCLLKQLRKLNLLNNKHIPQQYLLSDHESRLELLRGLMDTDSYVSKKGWCQFYTTTPILADNVFDLLISLGYKVDRKDYIATCNGKKCKRVYVLSFTPEDIVCKLTKKKNRLIAKCNRRTNFHYIKSITKVETRPVRCLTVDSASKLYLVGKQLIPTHNTTMLCIYALWCTCFEGDKRVVVVANKEKTAIMILRRIQLAYQQLPNWLKPGIKQWGATEVIFGNDSNIAISSTTGSAVRGESVNCLIIDEMSHIATHLIEEFWASVIPVISSSRNTKILVSGTPNGTGNRFYEIYSAAERGELSEWHHEKIDWWEVPGRGKKWKKEMLDALGGDQQLFDQEFGNVFFESGETAINKEMIEQLRVLCFDPIYTLEDGHYKIWKDPDPKHIYAVGVDVGEGIGRAASVVDVIDITDLTNIELVAVYHDNLIDPQHFAAIINKIGYHWGCPPLLVERNNCGAEVITALKDKHKYPNIVCYNSIDIDNFDEGRAGIYSNTNSKYRGVTNMRYWLNSLQVVKIYDIGTIHEMETFVRYPNGVWKKRPGNNIYDDKVIALIWALFILQDPITERYFETIELDERGKPLKIKSYTTTSPELFKLDSLFQSDKNAPLPAFIGAEPDSEDGLENLYQRGWRVLSNVNNQ